MMTSPAVSAGNEIWLPLVDAFRTFCRLPGLQGKMLFAEIASLPSLAA